MNGIVPLAREPMGERRRGFRQQRGNTPYPHSGRSAPLSLAA